MLARSNNEQQQQQYAIDRSNERINRFAADFGRQNGDEYLQQKLLRSN